MCDNHLLLWNTRGLNSRAHMNVVRTIVSQHRASLVCVQKTKLSNISVTLNTDLTGFDYDFVFLSAVGVAGGICTSWRRDIWGAPLHSCRRFSVTVAIHSHASQQQWWLTNVYGPTLRFEKNDFLQELRDIRAACPGPWLVCGDFNLIYQAADKNNGRLHRGLMRSFRDTIDVLQLNKLHLNGRLFTWSNGRDNPTLEHIDRAFASVEWLHLYPYHHL